MPAVLVFCMYLALFWVRGFDEHSATGRRLLVKHLLADATNGTRAPSDAAAPSDTVSAQDARTTAVFDDLSRRAEDLVATTCVFAAITSLTSMCVVFMLWRRVGQLQHMLQPEWAMRE